MDTNILNINSISVRWRLGALSYTQATFEAPFMKKSNNIEVGFRKSVAYKKSVYISNLQLIPREEVESYVFTDVLA